MVKFDLGPLFQGEMNGHSGTVVTHLPPTSKVSSTNPEPYVGKLVVSYRRSSVYRTLANCTGFLCPQDYPS